MLKFNDLKIAAKVNLVLSTVIIVLLSAMMLFVASYLSHSLEEKSLFELTKTNQLVVDMVDAYNHSLEQSAEKLGNIFAANFPGKFKLDESSKIVIGDKPTPKLTINDATLNLNFVSVDHFNAMTGGVATIFAKSGDDFIRISTSLKKENGDRAIGTLLDRKHPAYALLSNGESYLGKASLFGKDYMTRYSPIKNEAGKVIGILFIGLDFTDGLKSLKDKMRNIKIGNTGYVYALDAKEGKDQGVAVVHPAKEGANLLDQKDADGHEFIKEMITNKNGTIRYPWMNASLGDKESRQKVVVYAYFKDWNWIIASGTYLEEFTQTSTQIRNIIAISTLLLVLILLPIIYYSTRIWVAQPIVRAVEIGNLVAGGKLDNEINITYGGETGQLLTTMKFMQEKLNSILSEVEDCGRHMGQSAYQVAAISTEIADVSKVQESRSDEVTNAMQQLHQISTSVQALAIEAAERSRQIETLAKGGIENVQQNIGSMEQTTHQVNLASVEIQELEQSAQQINNIVLSIKGIAEQTNLLALNAAIEAARAGEQGRGFAVVADEVRKLAERTTQSAIEVGKIVIDLSDKVKQVAGTMDGVVQKVGITQQEAKATASTIESMAQNTVETAEANQRISTVSFQQLEQFGLLQTTLETLFSILKESGKKVETTAAVGEELRVVTGRMNKIMADFTFNSQIVIEASQHEKRRVPRAENSLRVKIDQSGNELEGLTQDISMTGLKLKIRSPIKEREPIDLSLFLPSDDLNQYKNQDPLDLKGTVSWQRKEGDSYLCGIQFANMNEAQRNQIKKCFQFLKRNAEF